MVNLSGRGGSSVSHLAAHTNFQAHRVLVDWHRGDWWDKLEARFKELTSLPEGWDGYQGVPVAWDNASFAAKLIGTVLPDNCPEPAMVPGADGTLQIEWHQNSYDIEIDVLGPNNVIATRYDLRNDLTQELQIETDFTEVVGWLNAMIEAGAHVEAA